MGSDPETEAIAAVERLGIVSPSDLVAHLGAEVVDLSAPDPAGG